MRCIRLAALTAIFTIILTACGGGGGSNGGASPPPPQPASFSVAGSASGLAGTGLVLQNSGGNDLAVTANGNFAISGQFPSGATYAVTVKTQPVNPTQTCSVANGAGTIASANVSNIAVTCVTNSYAVGGAVVGATGSGLKLQLAGTAVSITSNGAFSFPDKVSSDNSYAVTVTSQPSSPAQTCTVTNGSGTVTSADITNVAVNCSTNTYSVGGAVSGLSGTGLQLQVNGGQDLPIASNGAFNFANALPSGTAYLVTVKTQPSSPVQTCVVSNGSATVANANIAGVAVNCTTNTYSLSGAVSGLVGTGLQLQVNGGQNLPIASNGAFTFASGIASGATYQVTVKTQPTSPAQTCVIQNPAGSVINASVTNVKLTCTRSPARFAYVSTDSGLYCYAIDAISGGLVPLDNPVCDPGTYTSVAVDPSGQFAYATIWDAVVSYQIDQQTGALTRLPNPLVTTAFNVDTRDITIDTTGRFVYTSSVYHALSAFSRDLATGQLTQLANSPVVVTGLLANTVTLDPSDAYLYSVVGSNSSAVTFNVDPGSGELSLLAIDNPASKGIRKRLTFDPTNHFAFAPKSTVNGGLEVLAMDSSTGLLTVVAGSPFAVGGNSGGAFCDSSSKYVYNLNSEGNSVSAFSLNAATGALTALALPSYPTVASPTYAVVQGQFLYVLGDGTGVSTFTIDSATGALAEVSGSPVAIQGVTTSTKMAIAR